MGSNHPTPGPTPGASPGVSPTVAPPVAPARRGRRWGRIVVGILAIVFVAIPLLAVGIVLLVGSTAAGKLDPDAEGRVPGEVTFDAKDERYTVALGAGPGFDMTPSQRRVFVDEQLDVRCTVSHPDGSTSELRGDRQSISVDTSGGYGTIGEFDGQGGPTTVDCHFATPVDLLGTESDAPMIIHRTRAGARNVGLGLIFGSVGLGALSAGLIVWGAVRRRA